MSDPLKRLLTAMIAIACMAQVPAPGAEASIRVVKDRGVWWFEDSRGQRFFSLGVNCIGGCFGHAEDIAMEASRKERTVAHLKDQGFNTAASWSSPSVWGDFYVADQIYTGFKEDGDDVFDAALWKKRLEPCIREEVKPFLGRENFIGYFIDNEPTWNERSLFLFYLNLPSSTPGSRAFIGFLRSFYKGSLARLNRDWGHSFQSFRHIPGSSLPEVFFTAKERGDVLKAWRNEVARTYYSRCTSILRSLDPDHLVLGVRYKGIPDLQLFRTVSPYFDVNSINDYNRYGVLRPEFQALHEASGKPLMITEFSFSGFPDPGHRSMLFVDVYSQENRGIGYRKYVLEAARAPFMLGMHWFFWMDYPKQDEARGGFLPDENVGLVSNDESTTYEELAVWIKRTNRQVHGIHEAACKAAPPEARMERKTLSPFRPTIDGDVSEWPEATAAKPSAITALRDGISIDHTYYITHDRDALYVAADVTDSHLEHPGGEWAWTGDYLFVHAAPSDEGETTRCGKLSLFIYPAGSGPAGDQPYAERWYGPEESKTIPGTVARRSRVGGFGIEARIPWSSLDNAGLRDSRRWRVTLGYHNANEIHVGSWLGLVSFQKP